MNRTEILLIKIIEECQEVSQRCTKALRFGLKETQPGQPDNNVKRLYSEYADLVAAVELLQEGYPDETKVYFEQTLQQRKERVEKYLKYSQKLGILEDDNEDWF